MCLLFLKDPLQLKTKKSDASKKTAANKRIATKVTPQQLVCRWYTRSGLAFSIHTAAKSRRNTGVRIRKRMRK